MSVCLCCKRTSVCLSVVGLSPSSYFVCGMFVSFKVKGIVPMCCIYIIGARLSVRLRFSCRCSPQPPHCFRGQPGALAEPPCAVCDAMFAYVHSTAVTCHTLFMTGGLFKAGVISPNLLCGPPHPVTVPSPVIRRRRCNGWEEARRGRRNRREVGGRGFWKREDKEVTGGRVRKR